MAFTLIEHQEKIPENKMKNGMISDAELYYRIRTTLKSTKHLKG